MKFRETIEILRDDRFSWRFKLANLIMNDDLRLNLAFARNRMKRALEYSGKRSELCITVCENNIRNAIRDIDELWNYPE